MESDRVKNISVPSELYAKLAERLEGSDASTVEELAVRVLRDWVTSAEVPKSGKNRVSRTDEEIIERRLKALGYV